MKRLVNFLAGMPMPLLLGLCALALIQLIVMITFFIWPDQVDMIAMAAWIAVLLVFLTWMGVIAYELRTGKRVGRR